MAFTSDTGDWEEPSMTWIIVIFIAWIVLNVWSTWYYLKLRNRNISNQTHSLSLLSVIASWLGALPLAVVSPAVYYYNDPGESPFTK